MVPTLLCRWLAGAGRPPRHRPRRSAGLRFYRPHIETLEDRLLLSVFEVTSIGDAGDGSLRQAILDANANPGLDTITFNIGGGGAQTIRVNSALPTVSDPVVLDATTQPGFAGSPLITLTAASFQVARGLVISAGGSTVTGFVITGFFGDLFSGRGVVLESGGNVLAGNFIMGNDLGVEITGSGNTIGGTTAGARNLISNNTNGMSISGSGNLVQGNFFGTDVTGTSSLENRGSNITISSPNNLIGGTTAEARNLISGDGLFGVIITAASGNVVQGNFIGTDVTGTQALGLTVGVAIRGSSNNVIGGAVPGAGNVIVAPGNNVLVEISDSTGNVVQGNHIGTDVTGTRSLGAGTGVGIFLGSNNLIGGETAGARNLIAGSTNGMFISGDGNAVQGNYIGTDITGTQALGNVRGVDVAGANNLIGGETAGARNLISGNRTDGVEVRGNGNVVRGNYIGTDVTGTEALGNGEGGVRIIGSNNTVGGTTPGARNIISANGGEGVGINFGPATGNVVQGNYIGTDVTGAHPLGNAFGMFIAGFNNTIGGTTAGAGNRIAFNRNEGVLVTGEVQSGTGNAILRNSIFANAGLGIELINGGNNNQAFPVLTAAFFSGSTTVQGVLTSRPNTTFRLEFFANAECDPSGFGEGQTFVGSAAVTTDGSGVALFSARTLIAVPPGQFLAATATDPAGNTSQFSACVTATGPVLPTRAPTGVEETAPAGTVDTAAAESVGITRDTGLLFAGAVLARTGPEPIAATRSPALPLPPPAGIDQPPSTNKADALLTAQRGPEASLGLLSQDPLTDGRARDLFFADFQDLPLSGILGRDFLPDHQPS